MRIRICAVGRMRAGPERLLVADYLARFDRAGRPLGLGPAEVTEIDARQGGGAAAEAPLLLRAVPEDAGVVALDERGRALDSPAFAQLLAAARERGRPALAFVIGGADGLDPSVRDRADAVVSLGPMVWPHLLVRAMLAEQLYRAATILAGAPYHRG